jgi:cell division protein FtsB
MLPTGRLAEMRPATRRGSAAKIASCTAFLAAMGLLAIPGCSVKLLAPTAADSLREQVSVQAARIEALEQRERELEAQVRSLSLEADPARGGLSAEAELARPRLAAISLGSASALRSGAAGPELAIHLEPRDGRGRFLQIVGSLELEATLLPLGGEPWLLGRWSYGPLAVRDAWRGGLTGGHYTFREPVSLPDGLFAPTEIVVQLRFADAIDGGTTTLLRSVAVMDLAASGRGEIPR